mgnify:CR=1 FL=1
MSGNPDPEEVRQSKRAKVSRTIVIDGHTILRSNNYDIEEGERFWDNVDLRTLDFSLNELSTLPAGLAELPGRRLVAVWRTRR